MLGSYDYRVVVLSVVIALLASYAALELAGRLTAARGGAWLGWLAGGAIVTGIGIWSMHYTGMLAFTLPVPVQYHWPTVLLSLLLGILSSAVALFVVSRPRMGPLRAWTGGAFQGGGIALLHYTSMAAMRLAGMCSYSVPLVTLSVALSIAFSLMSLWLTFRLRDEVRGRLPRKFASVTLMGAGISIMHYTAMAAASFTSSEDAPDLSHAVRISSLGTAGIGAVAVLVLVVALLTSFVDRFQKQKALLDELFEQGPEAFALTNLDDRVVRVNQEFTRVFGYTRQEAVGRRLAELITIDESAEVQGPPEVAAQGQRVDAEIIHRRKDGKRVHVSMLRVPVSVPGGKIAAYAIFSDVTERKRVERDLERSFQQVRVLAARLQAVREEEDRKIARELHDEFGQILTSIKLTLGKRYQGATVDLTQIEDLANQLLERVKSLSLDLRPPMLDDLGLVPTLRWHFERYRAQTGISVRFQYRGVSERLPPETEIALFRIVQEALTNVARYAGVTDASVELWAEGNWLNLRVEDEGRGFDPSAVSGSASGLTGMRERVRLAGGSLSIESSPGAGTRLFAKLSLAEARKAATSP
jgi:PAS domain S-box-containing protein